MGEIDISGGIEAVLALCGTIAIVGAAWAVVWKAILPAFKVLNRVEALEEKSANDHKRLAALTEYDRSMARAVLALLENARTDNSHGKIAQAESDLQQFLIER